MVLKLNYLKLQITTSEGLFGVEIPFGTGLFILHANNTSGKSTCLQSIIYALGLEGMIGPSQDIPLPPVVTDFLDYEGSTYQVLESEVLLEISNGSKTLTVRRQIKGSQNRHLINVWEGAMLSQTRISYVSKDYFVRESGSASRELGFHRLLAEFVGWKLPYVPTYDEHEALLYMETVFPFMFVEQKHGWSNLRNRLPSYFRIKDLNRRVFEFLFALDAQDIATKKISLKQQEKIIKDNWSLKVRECNRLLETINSIPNNIPPQPISTWPPSIQPMILVSAGDEWTDISQVILSLKEQLSSLEMQEVPRVDQTIELMQQQLQNKQEELLRIETEIKLKFEDIETQATHITTIKSKISNLKEELFKNKDIRRLSNLGSVQNLQINSGICPTCEQNINDSLIAPQSISKPMTLEQNIDFIKEQLKIFEAMEHQESTTSELKKRQLNSSKRYAAELREDIRSIKTTLTSQNNAPSYAVIEERIRLTEKIRNIKLVRNQFDELLGNFSVLTEEWNEVQTKLRNLPQGTLSTRDNLKLTNLEQSFQHQLREYNFSSLSPSDIKISSNSYFPEYEGFDLQFNLSASDYIRIFWAYLLGLLEVSRSHVTNHLGLLILDEPRQQSAGEASIEAFINRASIAEEFDQQIIIATSESKSVLDQYLTNVPHTYRRFEGRIIAPM